MIVDVQRGFLGPHTAHVPGDIDAFLRNMRDRYSKVIATQFYNTDGSSFETLIGWRRLKEQEEVALADEISVWPSLVIPKTTYGAAEEILEQAKIVGTREIHFCGIDTDVCVLLNAAAAFDAGFQPKILYFLCATGGGAEAHQSALPLLKRLIGAKQVVTDVNQIF